MRLKYVDRLYEKSSFPALFFHHPEDQRAFSSSQICAMATHYHISVVKRKAQAQWSDPNLSGATEK
jgi:hypothetical protein